MARSARPQATFWIGVAALVAFTLLRAAGAFGSGPILPAMVLLGIATALAAWGRLSAGDVGLDTSRVRSGLVWGAGAACVVVLVLLAATAVPATRPFFDDGRVDVGFGGLVFELLVVVVLCTAIPEELIFRGVLLGTGIEAWGVPTAVVGTSVLFGLWHITPTLGTMEQNSQLAGAEGQLLGTAAIVVGSVLATFVAGLVFCWLRLRSQSLVAPILAHSATNGAAFAIAWALAR